MIYLRALIEMTWGLTRADRKEGHHEIRRLHCAGDRVRLWTMLSLCLTLSLLLACSAASDFSLTYQDVSVSSLECPVNKSSSPDCAGIYDKQLMEAIDDIIVNMNHPNDKLGLPTLDPLELTGLNIGISNDFIDINGDLSVKAVGLQQLRVNFAHFCISGFQLFLNVSLPSIFVTGNYSINGWLGGDLLYVFGDGPLRLNVERIDLYVNVAIKSNKTLILDRLELALNIGSITVNIKNLYHDAEVSEVLSEVLNVAVPTLLDMYHQEVTCFATEAVAGLLESKLQTLTMSDLLCLVAQIGCKS